MRPTSGLRLGGLLLCVGLAACQSLQSPETINKPLSCAAHVATSNPAKAPTNNGDTVNGGRYCVGMTGTPEVYVGVGTGAKLSVSALDTFQPGSSRFLIQSHYEWLLPSPTNVLQADLFKFSHLLAVSQAQSDFDPNVCYEDWIKIFGTAAIPRIIKLVESTMYLKFPTINEKNEYTAMGVQYSVRNIPPPTMKLKDIQGDSRQTLSFHFPLISERSRPHLTNSNPECFYRSSGGKRTLSAFDGGSVLQLWNDTLNYTENERTVWYNTDQVRVPRTFVSVLIPIEVNGELGTRYVPFYDSVRDVERLLHRTVLSIRRKNEYIPKDLKSPGNRSTLRFVRGKVLLGTPGISVSSSDKPELLLAPGDILFVQSQN